LSFRKSRFSVEREMRARRHGQKTRPTAKKAIRRKNERLERIKMSFVRGDIVMLKLRRVTGILNSQ
jgi:hypothetical protein